MSDHENGPCKAHTVEAQGANGVGNILQRLGAEALQQHMCQMTHSVHPHKLYSLPLISSTIHRERNCRRREYVRPHNRNATSRITQLLIIAEAEAMAMFCFLSIAFLSINSFPAISHKTKVQSQSFRNRHSWLALWFLNSTKISTGIEVSPSSDFGTPSLGSCKSQKGAGGW